MKAYCTIDKKFIECDKARPRDTKFKINWGGTKGDAPICNECEEHNNGKRDRQDPTSKH